MQNEDQCVPRNQYLRFGINDPYGSYSISIAAEFPLEECNPI